MSKKSIKITADSTCDVGEKLIQELDLSIIGLVVSLGDKDFRDLQNVFPEDIYKYVEQTGNLPKTAAPSPEDYKAFFQRFSSYDSVIHFNISSKMSASNQNARIAAEQFTNVLVVDSLSLSSGTGLLIVEADRLRDKGLTGEQIKAEVEKLIPHVQASFVVDTLEYLHKGGRCSGIARLGASIFRLHPMLLVEDGEIKVFKKLRGKMEKVYLDYVDIVKESFARPARDYAFLTYTAGISHDYLKQVIKKVREQYGFETLYLSVAGSTITSHCGAGTLGLLYIDENPVKITVG